MNFLYCTILSKLRSLLCVKISGDQQLQKSSSQPVWYQQPYHGLHDILMANVNMTQIYAQRYTLHCCHTDVQLNRSLCICKVFLIKWSVHAYRKGLLQTIKLIVLTRFMSNKNLPDICLLCVC